MKVWFPTIRSGTGADVFVIRLAGRLCWFRRGEVHDCRSLTEQAADTQLRNSKRRNLVREAVVALYESKKTGLCTGSAGQRCAKAHARVAGTGVSDIDLSPVSPWVIMWRSFF